MKKIEDKEQQLSSEIDFESLPPSDIIAYNELRSCADLYRMYKNNILDIQPEFQREIVWGDSEQTRFIDSLMKQLPIPSMCFSLDYKTQKWQVIDGLQRMHTLIRFLDETEDWMLSKLNDIAKDISGKSVSEIKKNHSDLYRRVENITLPITILRCDYERKAHSEYLFVIFHRLNTGGMKLNNQEIRNAIFSGSFNDFLKECNENDTWRMLLGKEKNKKDRFRSIELILRFFAFYDQYKQYKGRLTSFLNDYMYEKRFDSNNKNRSDLFQTVIELIYNKIANRGQLKVSNVVLEAAMFGVAKNISRIKEMDKRIIKQCYFKLIKSRPFQEENILEGIFKREKVITRLKTARRIFSR